MAVIGSATAVEITVEMLSKKVAVLEVGSFVAAATAAV